MRTAWNVLSIFVLVHVLAAGALLFWLHKTERLDRERWDRVVETVSLTIEQEREEQRLAAEQEEKARQLAHEAARLASVADGTTTLAGKLETEQLADEVSQQRVNFIRQEIDVLRRRMDSNQRLLARQKKELEEQRQAFETAVNDYVTKQRDKDFQLAVKMYEQVKPDQAKQMFQELIRRGMILDVVDYLAAMQLRKAADVLKKFSQPEDVPQAAELIEHLRNRGVDFTRTAGFTGPATTGDQP